MKFHLVKFSGLDCIEGEELSSALGQVKWMARIGGTDPKFGLKREFIREKESRVVAGSYYPVDGLRDGDVIEVAGQDKTERTFLRVTKKLDETIGFQIIDRTEAHVHAGTLDLVKREEETKKTGRPLSEIFDDSMKSDEPTDVSSLFEEEEPEQIKETPTVEDVRDLFSKKDE